MFFSPRILNLLKSYRIKGDENKVHIFHSVEMDLVLSPRLVEKYSLCSRRSKLLIA
jgi:hypothetical protein